MNMEYRKILFVGAHPDDIEIGCAGLINKLKDSNIIRCLVISDGENGGNVGKRQEEQLKANELLDLYNNLQLHLPDGNIQINGDTFNEVEKTILKGWDDFIPDIIFVHSPKDTHQDHRNVSEIIRSICYRKNIDLVFYDSFSSYNFEPNFYAEIEWDEKREVLEQFESQVSRCPEIITLCKAKAYMNGCKCNKFMAEGFRIDKISLK